VPNGERRLAAIMFTDIVGYTALTQSNEAQAMEMLERHNRLLRPFFPKFHGREVKAIGDSFLVEFESVLDALKCATEIQSYLHDYNVSSKEKWKIKLRIGIHLGDVIHRGGDVFGDAVNIASRIEPIAGPEGICVSQQVYDQVQNKSDLPLVSLGEKALKNVNRPVRVYSVEMPWEQRTIPKEEGPTLPRDRIAILPFRNMSPDPNDEYFAEGMTEETISTVSGISGLSVISRTSVMGYKGTTKKVEEIGRELRVGSVLEGSFRKAGNKIRVTTQLIDVATDNHLWAQNYDRELDDIFAVQSDVAKQVADALRVRILSSELERIKKRPTGNTDAYALYLKGRYLWNKRVPEEIKKAVDCFDLAIKQDPDFALAYVGLADCYVIMVDWGSLSSKEAAPKAKSLLATALRIDEKLAEAHASLAVFLDEEWEWSAAEVEYKHAIELSPNYATAHLWYSNMLDTTGRIEESLGEITMALDLDPVSAMVNTNLGRILQRAGRLDEAMEQYRKTLALEPNFVPAHMRLGEAYVTLSKFDEGIAEFRRAEELAEFTWPKCFIAYTLALAGSHEEAKQLLAELEDPSKGLRAPSAFIAAVHFAIGDQERAYTIMKKCVTEHSYGTTVVLTFPFFCKMQVEPRFRELWEMVVHGTRIDTDVA